MASVFSRIIAGELPGNFVWRDPVAVGLMTIEPFRPGHVLVIPREEIDHWDDVPEAVAQQLMLVAHRVARAQKTVFHPARVGIIVAGFEVPHAHVHVVPIEEMADLSFARAHRVPATELAQAAAELRSALRRMGFTAEAAD